MTVHPYAIIIGIGIGIMTAAVFRHPIFAIFAGIIAIILLDLGYRQSSRKK